MAPGAYTCEKCGKEIYGDRKYGDDKIYGLDSGAVRMVPHISVKQDIKGYVCIEPCKRVLMDELIKLVEE